MTRLTHTVLVCSCLSPLALPAATYQCDNYVITDAPSEHTGCVQVETGEPYEGGADDRFEGMDRFESVRAMMNEFGDFSEASESFAVVQSDPLRIRLMPRINRDEPEGVKHATIHRAAVYGVYRSFGHTPVDTITVEVIPRDMAGRLLPRYRETIEINRERALHIVQRHVDVTAIHALIEQREIGGIMSRNEWIESFAAIYYDNPTEPSLRRFFYSLQQ